MNGLPKDGKDARRFQGWPLMPQGWSPRQIAAALGVSAGAVSQWMTRAREGGPTALRQRPRPGAPRRLTADQWARVPTRLHRGAEAYGFRGPVWTCGRIAAGMRLEVGISSPPVQVGRLCQAIGWSPQTPARRARQRDDAAMAHGREDPWPALNRGRKPSSNLAALETNPGSIPCPVWSAPLPQWDIHPSGGSGGLASLSQR
jgi:transposase